MATLYIARHGNTFHQGATPTRIGRHTDLPLVEEGLLQAERLGAYFDERRLSFSHVFAAPLKRTMETAQTVLARMKTSCEITPEPALYEIEYGPDENKPEQDVIARIGEKAIDDWNENATPPPGWHVDPTQLTGAWRALFARVGALGPNVSVLAVTSNGVARFALNAASATGPDFPKKLRTGAFGRVDIKGDRTVITEWDVRP